MVRWTWCGSMLLARIILGGGAAGAQSAADSAADSVALRAAGAPVVLDHDTLFYLHGRLGPFSPVQRAALIGARLGERRRAIATGADSIRVVEVEGHSEILAGELVLMTVLDADTLNSGRSRAELAAAYATRIREVATNSTRESSLRALALDGLYALAATVLLVLLLKLLSVVFTRLYGALGGPRVPALRIQRLEVLSAARLSEALTLATRALRVVLTVVLFYFYVPLVLSFFPWTAPLSARIVGYVLTPLQSVWAGFLAYLPKVFFIAVIVLVTRYVLKLIHLIFRAIEKGALTFRGFHRDWAPPTYNIIRFLVVAFAVVVVFPYLPGSGSDAFKGVSLFVGLLFSFGSSAAIGNIIAGVVLTYTRAFQLGDRVKIGETTGDVIERSMLVTRLRTIKNVDVTIPNGAVLGSQVINYTSQAAVHGLILHTTVTIGYDADWKQVHELLIAAAAATPEILAEPAPFVLQTSLDDFYVSYEINAYTRAPAVMARTYSMLHQNIQDHFYQAGVEIMSPHYEALRDGNRTAIPARQLPKDYQAPSFRVARVEGKAD